MRIKDKDSQFFSYQPKMIGIVCVVPPYHQALKSHGNSLSEQGKKEAIGKCC